MLNSLQSRVKLVADRLVPERLQLPGVNTLIITFLLLGNFLFRFEIIILPALLLGALSVFVLFSYRLTIGKISIYILVNYSYWMISGWLSGAVVLSDLIHPDFINRDGRIFVYYIPLFIFSIVRIKRLELVYSVKLLSTIVVLCSILFAFWVVFQPAYFTGSRGNYFYAFHMYAQP